MSVATPLSPLSPLWMKIVALLAAGFGVMTLISGGNVLFGPKEAQDMAGDYVPFVVWFNFSAGFLHLAAAVGIWGGRAWAYKLSVLIAVATALVALAFGFQVMQGQAFEMRTVGALALRFGIWMAIALALRRAFQQL